MKRKGIFLIIIIAVILTLFSISLYEFIQEKIHNNNLVLIVTTIIILIGIFLGIIKKKQIIEALGGG